jgi:hypothetical protein
MKIEDKWEYLFSHDLDKSASSVSTERAIEAYVLINWAYDKYSTYSQEQGYEIPAELVAEKDQICRSLRKIVGGNPQELQQWPVPTSRKWAARKPFHEALGSRCLQSEWESFYSLASQRYRLEEEDES